MAVVEVVPILVDPATVRIRVELKLVAQHGEPLCGQHQHGIHCRGPKVIAYLSYRRGEVRPAGGRLLCQHVRHTGDECRGDYGVLRHWRALFRHSTTALPVPMMVP